MEDPSLRHPMAAIDNKRVPDVLQRALPAQPSRAVQTGRNSLALLPRRPRKARGNLGWDPTVDIYDDTFAFQRPQAGPTRAENAEATNFLPAERNRASMESSGGARLLTQPPRRYNAGNEPSHAANVRIRRSSPVYEDKNLPTEDEVKRKARRRTIYVPSDDTTILTIHPGASLSARNTKVIRQRRSDVFLDLAILSESSEVQRKETPRRPLAVTPRRLPLQTSTRQLQVSSVVEDIIGCGGGKENIPPGMLLNEKKLKEQSVLTPRKSAYQRPTVTSIAHSAGSTPVKSSLFSRSLAETLRKSPQASLLQNNQSPLKLSPLRRSQEFGAGLQKSSLSTSKDFTTDFVGQRVKPPFSSPLRSSIRRVLPSQHFNTSLLSQIRAESLNSYPLLNEDVSKPELYEDNWLNHQETALASMLNNILENAGHRLTAHSTDIPSLRSSLLNIYNNQENVLLHKRIQASLKFGALSISTDTLSRVGRFKDDLSQRQQLLDLWLKTYDLPVLQAAAEVVTGREVQGRFPTVSSSPSFKVSKEGPGRTSRSIENFLRIFLIRNEDVPAKSVTSTSPTAYKVSPEDVDDSGSTAWAWRRTVTRSLMLILLLDRSVTSGTFRRNLFQTSSLYKSSAAVLQTLSSILLPSIGDTSRILHHLSYRVSCIQYPLQDYTYHIKNLAVDLRDGVLLTRLIEILLYFNNGSETSTTSQFADLPCYPVTSQHVHVGMNATWPLSTHLKYPALSRAQKMYNIQIALSATFGVTGTESILVSTTARDIVDGHREKTVALLWVLVEKLGLATMIDSSLVEAEIDRLRRGNLDAGPTKLTEQAGGCQSQATSHDILLLSWARCICACHGVSVSNLTTSFADGKAYAAILAEYSSTTNATATATATTSVEAAKRVSNDGNDDNGKTSQSPAQILRQLNIPSSLLPLLVPSTAAAPSIIPSPRTTVAVLAILAARLLGASS